MKLTGINQLWVADITHIRLKAEFVYLAVILDAFSRKVVGWALDRTLASRLAIAALEQAIRKRQICQRRIRGFAREAWNDSEYESASEPLRQRQLRNLHQDFEAGGNLRERIRGLRAFACEPRTVHRAVLQSAALALGAGLQLSGRV